jgi:hypothetical protein
MQTQQEHIDSFILTIRNGTNSKQDFINFLIQFEEQDAAEMVQERWDMDMIRGFMKVFDGDTDWLGLQVYEFDEAYMETKTKMTLQ